MQAEQYLDLFWFRFTRAKIWLYLQSLVMLIDENEQLFIRARSSAIVANYTYH